MTTDPVIAPPEDVDVLCPLCEYNLRGLAEPRCPECGHRSTWDELLNRPPTHRYLFEHHPKHNIWSFVRTFLGSLRPIKFWRSVKPAMPIQTRRLIVFGLICFFVGLVGSSSAFLGPLVQEAQRNRMSRPWAKRWLQSTLNPASQNYNAPMAALVKQRGSVNAYLDQAYPLPNHWLFWKEAWEQSTWRTANTRSILKAASIAVVWVPLTLLSLMIFRASMRQAKIRYGHVLRCVLYSATPLCAFGIYLLASMVIDTLSPSGVRWWSGHLDDAQFISSLFGLLLAVRLMVAYRLYLRFHLAIATVIASQIIVALALIEINVVFVGY